MLSFPHFYLGDESFLSTVEGVSPPDKEKHKFFIDVHPVSLTAVKEFHYIYIHIVTQSNKQKAST